MSTPRRGRPAVIDRDAVIDGALRLINKVGVDGLTMKGLADELGVTTMAAYRYVDNKEMLVELVVQRVLSREAPSSDGDWSEQLWAVLWTNFEEVARYPGLADYLYRSTIFPEGRRLVEQAVEILCKAGMSDEQARLSFSDIYAYMIGRLVLASRAAERPATRSTRSRSAVPSLADLASAEHVRHGYDALISGLAEHT